MGDIKQQEIVIKRTSEGGEDLVECFYMPKPNDKFNFHDKDKNVKKRDITLGKEFSVVLDEAPETVWHLTLSQNPEDPDPNQYEGTWRTGIDPGMAEGTYQAEAGGSGEEEEPNAASAGTYS